MTSQPGPEALAASGPWPAAARLRPTALLAAVAVVLALGALAITTLAGLWATDPGPQLLVDATVGLTSPLVGALMILAGRLRRGARRLAWVFVVSGLCSAAAALTTALALDAHTVTPLARFWSQLQSFLWVPGFLPLLTLVPLLYPDGLLPGRTWRAAAVASLLGIAAFTVGVALYDEPLAGQIEVPKLVTAPGAAQVLSTLGGLLLLPSAVLALASLALRLRSSRGLARRQVVVLLAAVGVLAAVTAVQGLVPSPADILAQAIAVALIPLAVGIAVTRHRLYDLDLAVCRALVVISLTVCLAGAYLSVFALVQGVGESRSTVSAAVAAGVTGAVLQPLGRRLSAGVDRLYFGHRADPYVVTSHLATRLTKPGTDVADVPAIVCDTVVTDLRLRGARVAVATDAVAASIAATTGHVDGIPGASRFELRHRGEIVGWLDVSPRLGEQHLDEHDTLVIQGVADQAGPAIAALHLHRELQRSRESLVAARESERHRLRQDLHDGLGATLAGLRLQIETARDLTAEPTATSLLTSAGDGVAQAVGEVRTLCEGLRPPGLDDLGLPRALAALADRMAGLGLRVDVEVDQRVELDPAIEVALYRIAAEALANVTRHSGAAHAILQVHVADEVVELLISDDGVGFDPAVPVEAGRSDGSGLGLHSMRQRAEEVGGHLVIGGAPTGGALVQATLPITVGGSR